MKRKSSQEDLRRRGFVAKEERKPLEGAAQAQLIEFLHSGCAVKRSLAAWSLTAVEEDSARALLKQLSVETCLYTKIAITRSLEKGTVGTAELMTEYLGKIGANQYKVLPGSVSKKKSFPLPRDIIARSLGRMQVSVFPVLQKVLATEDRSKISEALDAIGFMAFYHSEVATPQNAELLLTLKMRYLNDDLILWKMVRCLSAFPCEESRKALFGFLNFPSVIGMEARRSLTFFP